LISKNALLFSRLNFSIVCFELFIEKTSKKFNGFFNKNIATLTKYDIDTSMRRKIVDQSISVYNEFRPHFSNHYLTPIKCINNQN